MRWITLLRQNGAGCLPERAGHRFGMIHVNCALIHAPIGLIVADAKERPLVHRDAARSRRKSWDNMVLRAAVVRFPFGARRAAAGCRIPCLCRRFGHTVDAKRRGNDCGRKQ
ncbi:hypothetical protein [Bradyrhizobium sacchari]|uniref:hypothetical protein n=1 Tax=Bradyrhizobium sacchari TaxID=1399419 RepID=UPI0010A96B7E|nr:hypothetical protein [Bradyrhizobium sacchari]